MELRMDRRDRVLSVEVVGRIDASNAVEFESSIKHATETTDRALIMDFGNLTYINSSGLRVLLLAAKSLRGRGSDLVLCGLSDQVREVFRISGFESLFPIHETRNDALSSLPG